MEEAWRKHEEALEELQLPKIHELKELSPELERLVTERAEKLLERDTEPFDPTRYKEPVQYYEPAVGTGGLPAAMCTCGWSKYHARIKVLRAAAKKHYNKTGHKPS